jgi:(R,R)-butanediol dehydrogenase / meso-butanediol dehydrogenase / diacetyl reductase
MKAAIVVAGGSFEVIDVPEPHPGDGELLIQVSACGLCGSDLKARVAMPEGTVMGHEFGGRVVGIGRDVTGFDLGTQVAVLPVKPCGRCGWCRAGYVIHCAEAQLVGLGQLPGGFAELAVASPLAAFAIPPSVDPLHAALVEPFAVGLHSVRTGGMSAGDDVLVIGAGSVGLTSIACARAAGAGRICAVDPLAIRRDAATRFGATAVVGALDEVDTSAFDLVIECVGKPGLLDRAVSAARPRSRVVVAGVCLAPDPFMSAAALMKEVTVGFSVYYTPAEFREVIDAFASGRVNPGLLLSATESLTAINEAFARFSADPEPGKLLLTA